MFNALVSPEVYGGWWMSPLQAFSIPDSCQDQRDHPICRKLSSDVEVIQQRVLSLVNLINAKALDSFDLNSDSQRVNSLNDGISLDLLSGLGSHLACSDYTI